MNLLLFAENSTNFSSIVLPALVISLFVIYIAFGFIKRSKINAETHNLFEKLQVGVKIKTYSGIYGEIVEIRDALDGSKVALIKTGEGDKASYISIDFDSIYAIDEKDNAEIFNEEVTEKIESNIQENK